MLIEFRQGIYRQQDTPSFLTLTNEGVNLNASEPTIIILSHGSENYLFTEDKSITSAWRGPFPRDKTVWLYWDIDLTTGRRTFNYTSIDPFINKGYGRALPTTPFRGQHFFLVSENTMKCYNGHTWKTVVRVFAGSVNRNSLLTPFSIGTQVSRNTPTTAGHILFNENNKPIKKSGLFGISEFVTTETKLRIQDELNNLYSVSNTQIDSIAMEPVPKFHCVNFKGPKRFGLASRLYPDEPCVGISVEDLVKDSVGKIVTHGVIVNPGSWNFEEPRGTTLWVGRSGELTTSVPQDESMQSIGYVIDSSSIFVNIRRPLTMVLHNEDCMQPTPSVTPTTTLTPTPTATTTLTPTPTVTPTNTVTPTPTMTVTPTVTPTMSPTMTVTPTMTLTPTVTVTPSNAPVPNAPSDLTATANGSTKIDLAWTDNASNETGYRVEVSATGTGGWSTVTTLPADSNSYSDTGLTAETEYFYRTIAFNGAGDSAASNVASATTTLNLWGNIAAAWEFDGDASWVDEEVGLAGAELSSNSDMLKSTAPANLGDSRGSALSGYAMTSDLPSLSNYAGDFTIMIWWRPSNTTTLPSNYRRIFTIYPGAFSTSNRAVELTIHPTNVANPNLLYWQINDGSKLLHGEPAVLGESACSVLTYDSAAGVFTNYQNGVYIGEIEYTSSFKSSALFSFGYYSSTGIRHKGYYSAARFFTRAISAAEVDAHYNSGSGLAYLETP